MVGPPRKGIRYVLRLSRMICDRRGNGGMGDFHGQAPLLAKAVTHDSCVFQKSLVIGEFPLQARQKSR